MNRLQLLIDFYEEEPNNPFNIYGLALEYQKHDSNKSFYFFNLLLEKHENYLPTYYIAGKLFEELENTKEAIKIFKKGIEIASQQKNKKTENELKNALFNLEMEL